MYGLTEEINQELLRGLLLIFLVRSVQKMTKEIDQELHRDQDLNRGPLLIFLIEDARKQ